MASEASPNYARVPLGDEDLRDEELDDRHSPGDTESPPLISVEVSPPPPPPSRVDSHGSNSSSASQTLSATNTQSIEQVQDKRRHSSLSTFERMRASITPSLHELIEKAPSATGASREYSHKKQRQRLLRLTIGEWINTLVLCIAYFGILYAYSRRLTIGVPQRRIFNALTTGNSLLLGVNLAASLRSYAKLLRWRMLAVCYRPLETFDLVMGCDSLINVFKLLWKARDHKYRYLPSRTQIICVLWILIHVAMTILVGIIGLNYNLEESNDYVLTRNGSISIVDLNGLSTGDYSSDLAAVQGWGVRGSVSKALNWSDVLEYQQTYFSTFDGHTFYYFQDQNANDSTQVGVSSRYIESYASCVGYKVLQGGYGNLSYITYNNGEKDVNRSLPAPPGPQGLLVISKLNSTCGPRCVEISAFQAESYPDGDLDEDDDNVFEGRFFQCNNTVPQVGDDTMLLSSAYLTYDFVGRMLAGAIGWSDNPPISDGKEEYSVYTNSSEIGFFRTPNAADMADQISSFTMGAIAVMDNSAAMYRMIVTGGHQPIAAQQLHVTWRYAGSILSVIPFLHFLALVAVISWANKAIIKDDSHLAIAKVYHTFLNQLGDRGCLLRGDEIVTLLQNPEVAYGWKTSIEHDGAMHVDIFEKGRDVPRVEKPFIEGWYDGGSKTTSTSQPGHGLEKRTRYRDVDAAEYF